MIDVTVIIPVYKVKEDFFIKCLDSICKQTYDNYEVIIVSDGAEENIIKICNSYCNKHKNFRIIKQKNSGVAIARNLGITMAQGNWIMFVDADDWLETTAIEKYIKQCDLKNEIVISGYYINTTKNVEKKIFFDKDIKQFNQIDKNNAILNLINPSNIKVSTIDHGVPWGKLYKRDFLIKNKIIFPERMVRFQDNIFNLYCFYYANNISVFTTPLYHYRSHCDSVTNKKGSCKIEYFNRFVKETCDFCDKLLDTKESKICINMKIFHLRNLYVVDYLRNTKKINYSLLKYEIVNNLELFLRRDANIYKYLSFKHKFIYIVLRCHMYRLIKMIINFV